MATPVKSAQRVLELLEYFAELRQPAAVGEIARSLGYPQSSTSVLLKSLADSGYLDHEPRTGMYVPSIRVALATAWIQELLYSERNLLRLMEGVQAQTGHTVMIGGRQGIHVRYLHVLQSTREGRFLAKIGSLRPLFHSAAGKMLLTTLSQREVAMLLRRANATAVSPDLRLELPQVCHEIEQVRAQGFALSTGTSVPGAAAMAVLIPVARNRDPMTLSVGGPLREIRKDQRRLLEVLRRAIDPMRDAVAPP